MKTARGEQRDLDLIEKVHQLRPFQLETPKERYLEMQSIGRPSAMRMNFVALVARLFGDGEAERVDRELPQASP